MLEKRPVPDHKFLRTPDLDSDLEEGLEKKLGKKALRIGLRQGFGEDPGKDPSHVRTANTTVVQTTQVEEEEDLNDQCQTIPKIDGTHLSASLIKFQYYVGHKCPYEILII